jgi:hypothetical protein
VSGAATDPLGAAAVPNRSSTVRDVNNDLVARACPPIHHLGPAFYFTPETVAAGKGLGLGGFRFYFLGRGGVLGDVEWPVVLSAFGYFKPSLVDKLWTTSRAVMAPRPAGRAFLACCQDFGRAHFMGVDGLGVFCEAAEAVNDAARLDPSGLTLWAGLAAEPLAPDLPARAMQLVTTLRELRGSAHLLAVVASGLTTAMAHRISRPDDVATFGWSEGEIPAPTAEDHRRMLAAEELTDALVAPAFAVLDDAGAMALLHGLDGLQAALTPT